VDENKETLNNHLAIIFDEVLPALTGAGIKYWVFGGVGIAGIVGRFLRDNKDIDVYIVEDDFTKAELVLKNLVEKHGDWDADTWALSYSMMKKTRRPKLEISIKGVERFSLVPVYKVADSVEFRVKEIFKLPSEALIQESKTIDEFTFFSPPNDVLLNMFRSLIERYIEHYNKPNPPDDNSRHIVDAMAVFTKEEVSDYVRRFNEKAKLARVKMEAV